jgi:hypothetical protein
MKADILSNFQEVFKFCQPQRICEIGTHDGKSATQFCDYLLNYVGVEKLYYKGYDAFDLASDQTHKVEVNGKGSGSLAKATSRLNAHLNKYPKRFEYQLVKGWTQDTLQEEAFDFVYIDGGHSYDTVKFDYSKVKDSKVIVFDDYQEPTVAQFIDELLAELNFPKYDLQSALEADHSCWAFLNDKPKTFKITKKGEWLMKNGKKPWHIQPVIFNRS